MATLDVRQIRQLLTPYTREAELPENLYLQLSAYLDLLLKWNSRTNLSAIRDPEEIVRRHFGESLFTGLYLPTMANSLLDFGSGAGFPGLPIQILRSDLQVTLAESQNKKASFLREVVRTLGLSATVWAERVEIMPPDRVFDVVTLRAVDDMEKSLAVAKYRVRPGGVLAVLTSGKDGIPIPGSESTILRLTTS